MEKRLIRTGVISSVNAELAMARVVFEDRDGLVSAELPILQPSCLSNKFYTLPDVGDSVVCLMTPNAQDGTGFILGSFYTQKNQPPAQNLDISQIKFSDGTRIEYDRSSHELRIECVGKIIINGSEIRLND